MSDYYDRDGNPMTREQWVELLGRGPRNKRVAEADIGPYWVSTVWLGRDHGFGTGPPLIFETMIFRRDDDGELDMGGEDTWRYSTEHEALIGHDQVVAKLRGELS